MAATEEDVNVAVNTQNEHQAYIAYASEPRTYQDAVSSPNSKQWEKAIANELKQLENTGTFKWVQELPDDQTAVGSKWVFKEKRNGKGDIVKNKARLVGKGFEQVPGRDFTATYSSVAKFATLRALLAVCTWLNWELHQVDVCGAYLEGDLEEEIYMKPPEGVNRKGFWKLLKAIYGLKQVGYQWRKKLDSIMAGFGFRKSIADDCLYVLEKGGSILVVVLVYVDDMAVAGPALKAVVDFKEWLGQVVKITNSGDLEYILGIKVS